MDERVGVAEWRGKDQVPYILKSVSGPNLVSIVLVLVVVT